jgi:hypothetical protein
MHYLGMLAFRLPVPVEYDWHTEVLSFLAAIFASVIALFVVSQKTMGLVQTLLGSMFMGGAIASMHYDECVSHAASSGGPLFSTSRITFCFSRNHHFAGGLGLNLSLSLRHHFIGWRKGQRF